jgi:tRNA(Ile)-lysidine synthase
MDGLERFWPGVVGLSGGGDSVALLHLLARWAQEHKVAPPVALIVDHGLKKNSGTEAKKAAALARKLGVRAQILAWKGRKPAGDLEAAAREARYRLMGDWCRKNGIASLYLAHTRDDQAETFLLRLARGSGLDGLSAMRSRGAFPLPGYDQLSVMRPLLGASRAALREFLAKEKHAWSEDPMNEDPRFARVRIRKAWPLLEEMGLGRERIADAAAHLARAREALEVMTEAVLVRACRVEKGVLHVEPAALVAAPPEVGLRALARILMAVSGQDYRPRFVRLERLYGLLAEGLKAGVTLHGCRIGPAPRARAIFGPGTLEVRQEGKRR